MKRAALQEPARAVLLDIEGTTTPIDFVYQTLFPFARNRFASFVLQRAGDQDVQKDLRLLHEEHGKDVTAGSDPPNYEQPFALEPALAYLDWLMDRDRKSTPLKSLQGKIWEEGFRSGEIRSQVFPDVPEAFKRWRSQSRRIAIYSSGSALAQRLLFAHTIMGDLTGFIESYFDTMVGAKRETESYRRIAESLALAPEEMVFISDVDAELSAAHETGIQTVLSVRPGNSQQTLQDYMVRVESFDAVFP